LTAQIGEMLLFFLTILLSGMLLSQLIEEKSNKIIEVIAAAVPIDALFVGKLFAMLAASVVGIVVWISAGALLIQLVKHGGVATLPPPAVGWTGFLILAVVYFGMNYLLLGAAFLTIGAQASTVREVQTMSMPVTFGQVLIFGFASTVIGSPDSPTALAAAIFPLSSPMAMLARAAQEPQWWPHVAAILWQGLWVALILRIGSQLFRKTVLKSGPRTRWWRRNRKAADAA
jgi:ABC-2 type transport system permease protein